jgi:hypothetical protein
MTTFRQFVDLPEKERVSTFEQLFCAALKDLLTDLAAAPWYVREREVVNLFVFRHLIKKFQDENMDIRQLCIEMPVLKLRKSTDEVLDKPEISEPGIGGAVLKPPKEPRQTLGKYGDIVVWPHNKATIWQTCRPFVHIEWKNISCLEKHPEKLVRGHEKDICLLNHNRSLVCASYAVLTDQRDRHVEIRCKRVVDGREPEDFFSEPLRCTATCPEKAIIDLQHSYSELLSRPQASTCPDCTPLVCAVPVCQGR